MRSRYKLFCFDMDGTLLDSMGYWCTSKLELFRRLGLPVEKEQEQWIIETSVEKLLEYYYDNHGFRCMINDVFRLYRQVMYANYERGIAPKDGAREYLRELKAQGVRVCVATATDRNIARVALEKAGMLQDIEFVTDIDEIGMGKEHPEFFRRLAEMAGVQPGEIVMFEDALYSIKGAKAAGCGTIAIEEATALPERDEIIRTADRYIRSYHELMN